MKQRLILLLLAALLLTSAQPGFAMKRLHEGNSLDSTTQATMLLFTGVVALAASLWQSIVPNPIMVEELEEPTLVLDDTWHPAIEEFLDRHFPDRSEMPDSIYALINKLQTLGDDTSIRQTLEQVEHQFQSRKKPKAETKPKLSILFDLIGWQRADLDSFDIVITEADLAAPIYSLEFLLKINKLHQLLTTQPDLFLEIFGHGEMGADCVDNLDESKSFRAEDFTNFLKLVLKGYNPDKIDITLRACNGGVADKKGISTQSAFHAHFESEFPCTKLRSAAFLGSLLLTEKEKRFKVFDTRLVDGNWRIKSYDPLSIISSIHFERNAEGVLKRFVLDFDNNKIEGEGILKLIQARAAVLNMIGDDAAASEADVMRERDGGMVEDWNNNTPLIYAQAIEAEETIAMFFRQEISDEQALLQANKLMAWFPGCTLIKAPIRD